MSRPRVTAVFRDSFASGDAVVHLAVALAMILAYASPVPYEAFLFVPGVSGWEDAYLSVLGHATLAHLLGNVVGFLALAGCSLLLLSAVGRRRLYYAAFVAIPVLVPPLAALQWVLYLSATESRALGSTAGSGFSILTAAFAGLLAVTLSIYGRQALASALPPVASSACLCSWAAGVLSAAVGGPVAATAGAGLLGLAFLVRAVRTAADAMGRPGGAVAVSRFVVALAAYLGATVDLFATGVGAARAHAVGFGLGFAVVWLVVGLERLFG